MSEQHEHPTLAQLRARARRGARLGWQSMNRRSGAGGWHPDDRADEHLAEAYPGLYSRNRTIAARARFALVHAHRRSMLDVYRELLDAQWMRARGIDGADEAIAALVRELRGMRDSAALTARLVAQLLGALSAGLELLSSTAPSAAPTANAGEPPPGPPALPPLLAALVIAPGAPSRPRLSLAARAA